MSNFPYLHICQKLLIAWNVVLRLINLETADLECQGQRKRASSKATSMTEATVHVYSFLCEGIVPGPGQGSRCQGEMLQILHGQFDRSLWVFDCQLGVEALFPFWDSASAPLHSWTVITGLLLSLLRV